MMPSIFNDVLGPVMVGPSSSHVAAAARIGRMTRCLLGKTARKVVLEFAFDGSLATTYHSQGSDMGFACGLLGFEPDDPRTRDGLALLSDLIALEVRIVQASAPHPNHYTVRVEHEGGEACVLHAISTGGGMIEVCSLDGVPLSLLGDCHVLLVFCSADLSDAVPAGAADRVLVHESGGRTVLELRASQPFSPAVTAALAGKSERMVAFPPVLPILTAGPCQLPFCDYRELIALTQRQLRPLSDYALLYESARGSLHESEVLALAERILQVMENAIHTGLVPQVFHDRILPSQAHRLQEKSAAGALLPVPMLNTITAYITAMMEAKSAMHPIVAAPTAGSCGALPGTLLAAAEHIGASRVQIQRALLAAGLVGVLFTGQSTFAAEVGGCQVECGAASGMAAAALTDLMGGSAEESLRAASIALQGITGLACDPVAGRVECPCLNKNIMAGANAVTSANMALSGYQQVIPLDETIEAIDRIGRSLPAALRCTCGGLGATKTSFAIQTQLER